MWVIVGDPGSCHVCSSFPVLPCRWNSKEATSCVFACTVGVLTSQQQQCSCRDLFSFRNSSLNSSWGFLIAYKQDITEKTREHCWQKHVKYKIWCMYVINKNKGFIEWKKAFANCSRLLHTFHQFRTVLNSFCVLNSVYTRDNWMLQSSLSVFTSRGKFFHPLCHWYSHRSIG